VETNNMRRWIKEPLLHFLLAGGLLFAAYAWLNRGGGDEPRVVRITAAEVAWLKESWAKQRLRPPSEQELRGLVTDYLKEELLAREAKEMGLDQDDTIVRRRLAQKMAFLVQDTANLAEPGEDVLRQFYDSRHAEYQAPARISFTQLYFKTEAAARRGLDDLKTHHAADLGDPSMLERDYAQVDEQMVASALGPELAHRVFALAPGQWHGPLASSYGFHLVRVDEQRAAQARPFEQVRTQVLDEWHRVQQEKASAQFFAGLLKKYHVVVEGGLKPLIGPLAGSMN
jgi:parvulin-like peptidyl-prolyl isomerase